MEYRRTNPHPGLATSPSRTRTYTNSILLDSWSISRDSTTPLGSLYVHRPCQGYTHNPTGLPVRSQGCTYNPTGLPVRSQGCTRTQTPNQDAPLNLSPPSRVLCLYTTYLTRDSTAQCVCSPGAGFNPPEFLSPCGLPVSCCLATSVVRSRSTGCPSAGPAWSSLTQDLHVSGRHESGIRTVPFPGPWRARRLDSAVWTFVFG